MDRISDAEIVHFLQLVRELGSASKAAEHEGFAPRSGRDRMAAARARGLSADTRVTDPLQQAHVNIKLLQRQLAAAHKKEDTAESIRKTIYGISERDPNPPKWITTAKGSGTPGCPMVMWSDWHYGEVVRPEEVGGMNEFNSDIAAKRIKLLTDRTIRLAKGFAFKEHKKEVKFPGIVVCLGGDMISGDIHEELADTNDRKPLECIDELVDMLIAALTQLADEFGNVFVPCVVGNHGRTSLKPRMKGRIITSYEWNLYCQLKRWFRNDKRLTFFIPDETDAYFRVMGHNFLLTHGDSLGATGGDGIIGAIGPIMRGAIRIVRSYAGINKPVDTIVIGHYHQELWLPGIIVNNSLKGDDEYARLKMRSQHSRPGQALWFVHPEQGITARMQVNVDDGDTARRPQTKPDWIVVPQ